jgi:hypothetical protein
VNQLIVGIFQKLVALDVLDVEVGVERKPVLVLAFILDAFLAEILFERFILLLDVLEQVVDGFLPSNVVESTIVDEGTCSTSS